MESLRNPNANEEAINRISFTSKQDKISFERFVNNYLREDGVLALRLLSRNAHDLIVSEVVSKLYDIYTNKNREAIGIRKV